MDESKEARDSAVLQVQESQKHLRALVLSTFGGVGAISPANYRQALENIAAEVGRKVDQAFMHEVYKILLDLPCSLD